MTVKIEYIEEAMRIRALPPIYADLPATTENRVARMNDCHVYELLRPQSLAYIAIGDIQHFHPELSKFLM